MVGSVPFFSMYVLSGKEVAVSIRFHYNIRKEDPRGEYGAKEKEGMTRKRFLAVFLLAALLAAVLPAGVRAEAALRGYSKEEGYVYALLGRYPQKADGTVEPILWRVLDTDGERAFLLSEYILFARAMHTSLKDYRDILKGDFAQTELCHYLNTTFSEAAFTEEESALLLPCENFGKVFLLSRDEMNNKEYGLGVTLKDSHNVTKILEDPGVRAWGTEWAKEDNGYPKDQYPDPKAKIRNAADMANITVAEKRLYAYPANRAGISPYWSRTQSSADARHACCTKANGAIGHIEVGRDNEGVRPAVYLAAGGYRIASGTGTMEDPYVILPAAGE